MVRSERPLHLKSLNPDEQVKIIGGDDNARAAATTLVELASRLKLLYESNLSFVERGAILEWASAIPEVVAKAEAVPGVDPKIGVARRETICFTPFLLYSHSDTTVCHVSVCPSYAAVSQKQWLHAGSLASLVASAPRSLPFLLRLSSSRKMSTAWSSQLRCRSLTCSTIYGGCRSRSCWRWAITWGPLWRSTPPGTPATWYAALRVRMGYDVGGAMVDTLLVLLSLALLTLLRLLPLFRVITYRPR